MKRADAQTIVRHLETVDGASKFGVSLIQSITVQANIHGSQGQDGRGSSVAIRVFPDDPRYGALEAMVRDEADARRTEAAAELAKLNVAADVDPDELEEHRLASVAAKAQFDDQLERNRIKRITAEAIAAAATPKAAKAKK